MNTFKPRQRVLIKSAAGTFGSGVTASWATRGRIENRQTVKHPANDGHWYVVRYLDGGKQSVHASALVAA